jgi:hypothetical protein
MTFDIPGIDFDDDPPDDELTPGQLHDRWESATNLQADDLQRLKDHPANDRYKDTNSSKAQRGDEPLNDALRLAETPRSDWRDVDDGFNEVEEAEEALDYGRRHLAQDNTGDPIFTDDGVSLTRRDVADARWGFDRKPDDGWP